MRKDKRIKNRPGNVARLPCRVRDHIARAARVDLILVGQVQDAVILDERNRLSSVMLEYFVRVCFFHEGHLKSSSCLPRAKSQPGPLHEGVTGPRPLLSTIAFRLKATRISTPPPYSMNHTFVSWVENERFSSAAFRGKRNRTPSTLPLPDRANSTRHGAILHRELAHR